MTKIIEYLNLFGLLMKLVNNILLLKS